MYEDKKKRKVKKTNLYKNACHEDLWRLITRKNDKFVEKHARTKKNGFV